MYCTVEILREKKKWKPFLYRKPLSLQKYDTIYSSKQIQFYSIKFNKNFN